MYVFVLTLKAGYLDSFKYPFLNLWYSKFRQDQVTKD